jgi:hypothetical protein
MILIAYKMPAWHGLVLCCVSIRLPHAFDGTAGTPAGFVAPPDARHAADATAATGEIDGEFKQDSGRLDAGRLSLDDIPARSEWRGGLHVRHDPRLLCRKARAPGFGEA